MAFYLVPSILAVTLLLLYVSWTRELGFFRGSLAAIARLLWILPIIGCLFPKTISLSSSFAPEYFPLHILLDDSDSMNENPEVKREVSGILGSLASMCEESHCRLQVEKLSRFSEQRATNFTPMSSALEGWLSTLGQDRWLVLTDGGDEWPTEDWTQRTAQRRGSGGVVGFVSEEKPNIYIQSLATPPLAFQDKAFNVVVKIGRNEVVAKRHIDRVQIQVWNGDKVLSSQNIEWRPNDLEVEAEMVIAALPKGQHFLEFRLLSVRDERELWDNQKHAHIDVMANTLGALHLLGSPSWDGRFIRQFLKSEPKFDLISFFILRDRWDPVSVPERELSLIPFPVQQLFQEELPNFRLVVMQNFNMHEFLEPSYQENLVQFVQEGGGLLFIGGPRALQHEDIANSPLRRILPFDFGQEGAVVNSPSANDPFSFGRGARLGSYDENAKFSIELSPATERQKNLVSLYRDWQPLLPMLSAVSNLRGLHKLTIDADAKDQYTPILNARLEDGRKVPLALASYPGKGRALWLFSDSFWRIAMAPAEQLSRDVYRDFFSSALRWLIRDEIEKPIAIRDASLRRAARDSLNWRFMLFGSAAYYLSQDAQLDLYVCGEKIAAGARNLNVVSERQVIVSGSSSGEGIGDKAVCGLQVYASHPAFGSLNTSSQVAVPRRYSDAEMTASKFRVINLANALGVDFYDGMNDSQQDNLVEALRRDFVANESISPGLISRVEQNVYWLFNSSWFWFLILFMPVEVIIRRWKYL